jgi:4'-phosphopantetheinyl transferase EntD
MDTRAVLRAWRTLVPADVFVSAGPILDDAPSLTKCERVSAGRVNAQRLLELENGRAYAKRALAMIGFQGVELPIAADRSPSWPTGAVGSITHVMSRDGGHFAAAVARTHAVCAVGIDVEPELGLHPCMWNYVLTTRELKRILELPLPARAAEAQVMWCAKEAAGKAALRPLEPTEVEIHRNPNGEGYVATIGRRCCSTQICQVRTIRLQGLILAAAVVPRRHGFRRLLYSFWRRNDFGPPLWP